MSARFPSYKAEFLYLTTTGWRSGQAHEIEIWYVAHQGCYYLCAGGRQQTHWVRNIQHNSAVSFFVGGRAHSGTARALDPAQAGALAKAVAALFQAKYQWSDGLLVELCPDKAE